MLLIKVLFISQGPTQNFVPVPHTFPLENKTCTVIFNYNFKLGIEHRILIMGAIFLASALNRGSPTQKY